MNDQFLKNFLSVSSKCCACLTGQSIGTLLLSQDLQLHLARIAFSCALTFCGHQLDECQDSVTLILCHAEFETQWQDDSVFRGCPSWLAQSRVTLCSSCKQSRREGCQMPCSKSVQVHSGHCLHQQATFWEHGQCLCKPQTRGVGKELEPCQASQAKVMPPTQPPSEAGTQNFTTS